MKVRHRRIERKPALALVKLDLPRSRSQNHARMAHPDRCSCRSSANEYSSLKSYAQLRLILSAFDPDIATEVEATSNPALLEREDCMLLAWYRSIYAPRAGGGV
jgi:hypothetical protein